MDFKVICRICLQNSKQAYDLFTSYYLKRNTLYSDMLSTCTKLRPYIGDGLPRLICKDCCRQLKRTYAFNIQCEENDKKLRCELPTQPLFTNGLEILQVENSDIKIKNEDQKDIKIENSAHEKTNLVDEKEVKSEQDCTNDGDDSSWDAADDNLALREIKAQKLDEDSHEKIKLKKKRGRKKRDGVPQLPDSKLPHQCDICGKVLSTKSNLKAHKICHTDLRPYQCNECSASFKGHSALFQHKRIHTGETPYHCEYCPKQFSRRTGLINHTRMHMGEKQFSCDICFKSFVQSAQLSIHMKRHKGDKPFLCQDCGKGFPIKADLKVHQRIHNGEKPYACHLCTKSFATSGNLSIHIRIHNKEIRYNCKECNRGFVTCSAYKVHLKRHKGQRDYHCECGKTFYTSSALKQHKVVHTGEKKYQCKLCERKFTQTSHLSRHFKRDHAKPNLPVPPSDQYKIVLQEKNTTLLNFQMPKVQVNGVKSEGT